MAVVAHMHWITAIEFARAQPDVTYQEWCDMYYNHRLPSPPKIVIEEVLKTARPILIRNKVISESVKEFQGVDTLPTDSE